MENKDCNIFFQENEEDYLDDPIRIFDFEENIVFRGSQNYFKNITIEDPGYVVNISLEDYEVRLRKSSLKLEELKNTRESCGYVNNKGNFLSKCRTCSINLVDCLKFPRYYRNIHGSTNKTQYLTEHNVIEIRDEKDEEVIMIIDLTEEEDVECNKRNDDSIQEQNDEKIGKVKNELTNIDNSVGGKVKKQTYKTLSKPVLNIQNESHTKAPRSEAEQATDLIISTYTRLTDKALQKLKSSIEYCQNSKNVSHNQGSKLWLGKSFLKNCDNMSKAKKFVKNVTQDNINNNCKNTNHKMKNIKNSNKVKNIYTSEQISKTKIKIKKSLLKCKGNISSKKYYKAVKDKGYNLSDTNREQYDSLQMLEKKHNSFSNEKQQKHCENKQEKIQCNSNSYQLLSSPVLKKIITETKKSASLPNRNNDRDRMDGCNKQLFSADRIIPHFHKNTYLNDQEILSKTKSSTKYLTRSKETMHSNVTKNRKKYFDSTEALNTRPMVYQIPNPSIPQRIHDNCTANNTAIVNINGFQKKNHNRKNKISNLSAIRSVNPFQATHNLPVNNEMFLKMSTLATPDVITENGNNIVFMSQSKKKSEKLEEEERLRYLLPSNCIVSDSHIQNIFSYYDVNNLNISNIYKNIIH